MEPTDRTGKALYGASGIATARGLIANGWCVIVVAEMPSGTARGFWAYEQPLSDLRWLIGDDMSVKRRFISDKIGPAVIVGLELFKVLDTYTDSEHRMVYAPGEGVRHVQMRHYRSPVVGRQGDQTQ